MKANQNFRNEDEAVSPVIGVILMVAITVVLAAVVFILVNDLGSAEEQAPDMGFSKNNDSCTITVVKAPSGSEVVQWDTTGDDDDINVTASSGTVSGFTDGDDVDAGDIVTIDDGSGACGGITVTVRHISSNTLVYTTEFT